MTEAQNTDRSQPDGGEPAGQEAEGQELVRPDHEQGHEQDPEETSTADLGAIEEFVTAWRSDLDEQVSVPASNVQDRLLDLWGTLPEGQMRIEVERWLTETLARNLYTVSDIGDRLDTVVQAGS
jgi:hypothetical protein